eukprot:833541_1
MREFGNTLRIGFDRYRILSFPTNDILLAFYMIDCAMMRKDKLGNPNCWQTIRGKLCAIDHFNKLALTPTSWSENPALFNLVDWCKKMRPSDPTRTALPFTKYHLIKTVEWLTKKILYATSKPRVVNVEDEKRKERFLITSLELERVFTHWTLRTILVGTSVG